MSIEELMERFEKTPRQAELAKKYFGIVVVMDALGAKSLTIEGAFEFLQLRDNLVLDLPLLYDAIQTEMVKHLVDIDEAGDVSKESEGRFPFQPVKHEVLTFGDSFILLYPCSVEEIALALKWVAEWCAHVMSCAMEQKVFLRGAFSVGEYLYGGSHSNTVLGPAVADAASWCEQADWIGVTVTPSAGYFLEQLGNNPNDLRHHSQFHFFKQQSFVKYHVPIKGGGKEELWTLMWPRGLFDPDKPDSMRQKLAEYFAGAPMPKGTESKYANTWKYVNWLWEKSLEWVRQGDGSATSLEPTSKS